MRGRPNLTIATEALVQRLLVAHGICQGAEYRQGGTTRTAYADGEVVLAAGTIVTPQLLMLSGIGPGGHLRERGLAVDVDLPGVGENLQDHAKSQVAYAATQQLRGALSSVRYCPRATCTGRGLDASYCHK